MLCLDLQQPPRQAVTRVTSESSKLTVRIISSPFTEIANCVRLASALC